MKIIPVLASLLNYDAIAKRRNHQTLNRHLPHVLKRQNIHTVIDVGANAGQFSSSLREGGFQGRIVAFEPIPAMAQAVKRLFAGDALFQLHNCGLGEVDGEMNLNIFEGSDFSSFLSTNDQSKKFFQKNTELKEVIQVPVKRLDQVDGICEKSENLLLKLDTQGFDLNVFAGATALLPQIKAVLIECSVIPLYKGMPDFLTALTVMRDAGFLPSGFFPVSRDKTSMAIIEFDCVLVRESP